jgi:hypothetical protein
MMMAEMRMRKHSQLMLNAGWRFPEVPGGSRRFPVPFVRKGEDGEAERLLVLFKVDDLGYGLGAEVKGWRGGRGPLGGHRGGRGLWGGISNLVRNISVISYLLSLFI